MKFRMASDQSVNENDSRNSQRKIMREDEIGEAINAIQKAIEMVCKYCINENFRQKTMTILKENDWTRVPDVVNEHLIQLAKMFHNVDISKRPGHQLGVTQTPTAEEVGEAKSFENDDDDFNRLAAYTDLIESEL